MQLLSELSRNFIVALYLLTCISMCFPRCHLFHSGHRSYTAPLTRKFKVGTQPPPLLPLLPQPLPIILSVKLRLSLRFAVYCASYLASLYHQCPTHAKHRSIAQVVGYEEDLTGRQKIIDRVRSQSINVTPAAEMSSDT